ncbi:MAG: L,D-transpeptidase [Anaerolineae bacterium]
MASTSLGIHGTVFIGVKGLVVALGVVLLMAAIAGVEPASVSAWRQPSTRVVAAPQVTALPLVRQIAAPTVTPGPTSLPPTAVPMVRQVAVSPIPTTTTRTPSTAAATDGRGSAGNQAGVHSPDSALRDPRDRGQVIVRSDERTGVQATGRAFHTAKGTEITLSPQGVPQDHGLPAPTQVPAEPIFLPASPLEVGEGRWIDVDLTRQTVTAYEGAAPVRTVTVSTGLPGTPTPVGQFRIWVKFGYDDMEGPGYYLRDVPYTMYFHGGYGLHGTYWHDNFGHPMSHGCVNLPTPDAEWLFHWAEVGTLVNVHD